MEKSNKSVTVMIADKDPTVLSGLKLLIEMEEDLRVVALISNHKEIVNQTRKLHPDVILMDVLNKVEKGLDTVRQIKKEFPGTKVIIITTYPMPVREVLHAGASHIFLKDCVPDELFSAIRT